MQFLFYNKYKEFQTVRKSDGTRIYGIEKGILRRFCLEG